MNNWIPIDEFVKLNYSGYVWVTDGELCDVCYWRKRAEQEVNGVISSKVNVWVRELPDFLKEQA